MSVFDGKQFIGMIESLPAVDAEEKVFKAVAVGVARGFVQLINTLERIAAAQETIAKTAAEYSKTTP